MEMYHFNLELEQGRKQASHERIPEDATGSVVVTTVREPEM
jgi:hypothetical protein